MNIHHISSQQLSLQDIKNILDRDLILKLSDTSIANINKCRSYVDEKIKRTEAPIYGVNTGFGSLYDKSISEQDLESLQKNLVMSHACGTGDLVPDEIVRIMLLLKIQGLSYGNSGVHLDTVNTLIDLYNNQLYPVVYQQGSLGASGDLAPLAHMSLPLLGLGEVMDAGKKISGAQALEKIGRTPLHLKSKEGLALLNGTQFMSAYGIWALIQSERLTLWSDTIAALSLEAFDGRPEPFHPHIQDIRPHNGQIQTAKTISLLLEGSELISRPKTHVQDPYSFRCVPQVHGASKDAIGYVTKTMITEINSVTDNPTVFPDDDLIISAGNFHGQPLAIALDILCIALSELGNISERRTYQLISGLRNLPPFLVANAGLNSGFMIPQYTAASIVSQNKQLCTPASVDSIVSSNGQEDHVSMGANAATKSFRVLKNVESILAIELLNATQAIEFRRPAKTSPILEKLIEDFRKSVSFMTNDRVLHNDIATATEFIQKANLPSL